jgi:hypothetical protein
LRDFSFSRIMFDRFLYSNSGAGAAFPRISERFVPGISVLIVFGMGGVASVHAQAPAAAAYPVDPSAAAGMTTGMPNGVTSRQAEMVEVRTSAQGAQGVAAAASMARSADQTMEERNRDIALQSAREKKSIKQSMSDRLKFERASASYNKVSSDDMSTWTTPGGGVRVERNVPDAFLMSLIEAEEQEAARAAASGEKKGLFHRNTDPSDSGGGFLSNLRPPRLPIPSFGGRGNDAPVTSSAPVSDTSEPTFARTSGPSSGSANAPVQASAMKPGVVPMISGAALVDGRSNVSRSDAPPAASSSTVSFADQTPDTERKKPGLFSKLQSGDEENSMIPASSSSSGGGGFFGFGKKKAVITGPSIDAGLFPDGAVTEARVPRSFNNAEVPQTSSRSSDQFASESPVSSSSSSVQLPGQTMEKEKSRGFSIPTMSIPSISKSEGRSSGSVPTLTTVNSSGSSYYVVASTAQFMVYGESQMQSEVRALPVGTLVLMTKPGEQWASVRLPNGTEGIIQNKHLRPASGAESGGGFATSAPGQ